MSKLIFHLKLYKIREVSLTITTKLSYHLHYLFKELNYYGYIVNFLVWKQKIAHNGVRGKKIRRV